MEQYVRLDEFDGTLRRDVPPELHVKGGEWVELRRYTPRSTQRAFDWELSQWNRELTDDPNVTTRVNADGSRTSFPNKPQLDAREHIWRRMIIDRVRDWSFKDDAGKEKLPVEPASLELIPDVFVDAMLDAVLRFNAPIGDEEAFRVGKERLGVAAGPNGAGPAGGGRAVEGGGVVEQARPALA